MTEVTHAIFLKDGSFAGWVLLRHGLYETPTRILGSLSRLEKWIESVAQERIAVVPMNCLSSCHWKSINSYNPIYSKLRSA